MQGLQMMVSLQEVALRLGLSFSMVRRYAEAKRIKIVRLGGRVMVTTAELDRLMQEGMPKLKVPARQVKTALPGVKRRVTKRAVA